MTTVFQSGTAVRFGYDPSGCLGYRIGDVIESRECVLTGWVYYHIRTLRAVAVVPEWLVVEF